MKFRKYFKYLFLLLALPLLFLLLGSMKGDVQAADPTWTARYWNNRQLSGTPVLQRQETTLNYDWGTGSPLPGTVSADNFSARWEREIHFTGGNYRFTATMDDGMRVWVDNRLIIDSWIDSAPRSISQDVNLSAGDYPVKVEYYEAGGGAVAKLTWAIVGSNPTPSTGWRGEYFNNTSLSGSSALIRQDNSINFDWGVGSPAPGAIGADNFSVRWTNTLSLQSGNYRFTTITDDGVRLWVNGSLIIDEWHDAYEGTYTANIDIPTGTAEVRMEYYENVGGAVARLDWLRIGGSSAGTWYGEYFNNRSLTGSPALVRNDTNVNFNWFDGSPAIGIVNNDNFSVRWTNSINFSSGVYRFTATSDDGVRVWVNNQLIIDAWNDHAPTSFNGQITLSGGSVPIRVEYYENTGGALISLTWSKTSAEPTPSPSPSPPTGDIIGTVVSPALNVRYGPGLQYGVITQLQQGDVVGLTGYRAGQGYWVMINWQGGEAWVSGHPAYLSINVPFTSLTVWTGAPPGTGGPGPTGGPTAIVFNCNYLNVRSSPVVGNNVVTVIPAGTVVSLLGRNSSSTWAKIQLVNGTVGWSSATYLDESVPLSSLPVVQ